MTSSWQTPQTGSAPRTSAEVAELLSHSEASLANLKIALAELEVSPSFLMMGDSEAESETVRRYGRAAREAKNIWPLLQAAEIQLEAARTYMAENGVNSNKHRTEAARLLQDPWHVVSDLVDREPEKLSLQQTIKEIRRLYDAVEVGVDEIDHLWSALLPRIKAALETTERLRVEAEQLEIVEPLIDRASALAKDLADRLTSDPLSVTAADGPVLDQKVAQAATQIATMKTGRDNLDEDMASTEGKLAGLRVLRVRAQAAWEESSGKIKDPEGLIRVPSALVIDGPDGLASRLDALFQRTAEGAWTQKRSVLDLWLSTVSKLERQLERAEVLNRAPMLKRDELRGRLTAYQAKAAGLGRAEDLALMDRFDEVRALLYTSPTDLKMAEVKIAALAGELSE